MGENSFDINLKYSMFTVALARAVDQTATNQLTFSQSNNVHCFVAVPHFTSKKSEKRI